MPDYFKMFNYCHSNQEINSNKQIKLHLFETHKQRSFEKHFNKPFNEIKKKATKKTEGNGKTFFIFNLPAIKFCTINRK